MFILSSFQNLRTPSKEVRTNVRWQLKSLGIKKAETVEEDEARLA